MKSQRNAIVNTFYRPEMVCDTDVGFSKSPNKPKEMMDHIGIKGFTDYFKIHAKWKCFDNDEFRLAHIEEYVESFFKGEEPLASTNGLDWNTQFAQTVRYTNSSLYHALLYSILNPDQICFSPTSGFHHAGPGSGSNFCTFSGQVIASLKLYQESKVKGAWIDLDGHYGNSIPDSRDFVPQLDTIIPENLHLNPNGSNEGYIRILKEGLSNVQNALLNKEIDYVVLCHGADSHEWDDLGGQCDTKHWLKASRLVYEMILETERETGSCIPFSMCLFGGYRRDDYNSVLELHLGSLMQSLEVLCDRKDLQYAPKVTRPLGLLRRV